MRTSGIFGYTGKFVSDFPTYPYIDYQMHINEGIVYHICNSDIEWTDNPYQHEHVSRYGHGVLESFYPDALYLLALSQECRTKDLKKIVKHLNSCPRRGADDYLYDW